jgi:predicted metalloprotease
VLQPFPVSARASATPPVGAARIGRDVQQTWRELFGRAGVDFRPAKLVVLDRVRQSQCGIAVPQAAEAFYCALDTTVSFSGGAGDPYLIAHVYAHHVQHVLGITEQIARGAEASPRQARDLWLRHELQADCLAGVWAHSALRDAAPAIRLASIPVNPDHAADVENWAGPRRVQRVHWFLQGFRGGDASACNAFTA